MTKKKSEEKSLILEEETLKELNELEKIKEKPKNNKKPRKIILVANNYYIIDIDGNNVFITGKTDKKKGDTIFY